MVEIIIFLGAGTLVFLSQDIFDTGGKVVENVVEAVIGESGKVDILGDFVDVAVGVNSGTVSAGGAGGFRSEGVGNSESAGIESVGD